MANARLTHAVALVRAGTGTSRNLSNPFRVWLMNRNASKLHW
jgi:hypothetical protein